MGSKSVALTDDLGRMVTITKAPMRIISLSPSNIEILFALGLENRVVGMTKYFNFSNMSAVSDQDMKVVHVPVR